MGGKPTRIHHPRDAEPPFELKGWKIRFNTYTMQGRENCAHASLAFFIGAFAVYKMMSKQRSNKAAELGELGKEDFEPLAPPLGYFDGEEVEDEKSKNGCGKLE